LYSQLVNNILKNWLVKFNKLNPTNKSCKVDYISNQCFAIFQSLVYVPIICISFPSCILLFRDTLYLYSCFYLWSTYAKWYVSGYIYYTTNHALPLHLYANTIAWISHGKYITLNFISCKHILTQSDYQCVCYSFLVLS